MTMTSRRPRARKWGTCTGCGQPTRQGELCPACVEQPPPADPPEPDDKPAARRRRPIESGWCITGRHGRCCHLLQTATDKRPEILCSCRCHRLTRNMTWAQAR